MYQKLTIPQNCDGMRIDIAMTQAMQVSRRSIRRIIDEGGCYLNGKRLRVASRTVHCGQKVELFSIPKSEYQKLEKIELSHGDIIFEDEYLVIVNKPAGLPSQATRNQSKHHLLTKLASLRPDLEKAELIHRLDVETSGCIIFAKKKIHAEKLFDLFRNRKIFKTYLALCWGEANEKFFEVNNHLSTFNAKTGKVHVSHTQVGKSAKTKFEILDSKRGFSLIKAKPLTGRTHQIRVHLSSKNLPIVGDKKYGDQIIHKLANSDPETHKFLGCHHLLHAFSLEFRHPFSQKNIVVHSTPPFEMGEFLAMLGMSLEHCKAN